MAKSPRIMFAAVGALLVATTAQADPAAGDQARSNGPNMPRSRDVVPSEIRPQDPPSTGSMQERDASDAKSNDAKSNDAKSNDAKSKWHDIKRPPVRPPGL